MTHTKTLRSDLKKAALEYSEQFKGAEDIELAEMSRSCGFYAGARWGIERAASRVEAAAIPYDQHDFCLILADAVRELARVAPEERGLKNEST